VILLKPSYRAGTSEPPGLIMAQFKSLIIIVALSGAAIGQAPLPTHPEAVVDTSEFMTWLFKPAYVDLQRAIEHVPSDRAEWAAIYQKAVRLAETANLLFIRHHAAADTPEWAARSAAARQAAIDVADAALIGLRNVRPKDFDAVQATFPHVAGACNACHRQFGGTNAPTIRH